MCFIKNFGTKKYILLKYKQKKKKKIDVINQND